MPAGQDGAIGVVAVVVANAFNLLIVAIMASRVVHASWVERAAGVADAVLLIVLAGCITAAAATGAPWWAVLLPLPLVAYLVVEIVLDQVLHSDFRRTRLLGPYLLLFYAGQFAMIGYAFLVGRPAGFLTLVTYFASLLATWWSYRRAGHGPGAQGRGPGARGRGPGEQRGGPGEQRGGPGEQRRAPGAEGPGADAHRTVA